MKLMMSLFLGLVQGITEFLPVSSSGHLSILQNLFKFDYDGKSHMLFDVLLHLGTMVSICIVYRAELKTMIRDGLEFIRMRSDSSLDEPVTLKPTARTLLFILIATIPMFITVFFTGAVDRLFRNTGFIGFAMLVTGGLLFVSDRFIQKGNKTEKSITLVDAIIIGLAQAVAVLPGLSRSGATISVGISRGLSGSFAVRFSLLLSIPAVFGAMIVSLFRAIRDGANFALFPVYLAGAVISAGVGYITIYLVRRLVAKGGFGKFAYYCWGVGALALILSLVQL